jgi:DNA-binding PadR family transcriptional regulator
MDWGSRGSSPAERPDRESSARHRDNSDRFRAAYRHRDREYSLRESEVRTLIEIGKFRVVPTEDLSWIAYRADRSRMENDLQNLRQQGLVEQRDIEGHDGRLKNVFALTREAHRLLTRQNWIPDGQAIYHGFVKPKEIRHDADLYRLYHQVAEEIEQSGGKVRRVVLDYELKRELYKQLSQINPDKYPAYERIRVANEYDLHVVNDKIPVPDLRIEYEDECRNLERLDLEIATRDYRPQGLAEKAKAGFHLFAREQDRSRLRRVLDSHEITARIFAL